MNRPMIRLSVAACLLAGMGSLALAGEDPRLDYARVVLKQGAKPAITLKLDESLGQGEAFRVAKTGGKTVIECGSPAGAVYGALAVARDEFVPGAIEKPDFDVHSETKHNQESLTSPVPDRRHEQWKGVLKGHIVNLHGPPMDLEPLRWASPRFIAETVGEWKKLGFLKGAEIYITIFWQWPYALDKLEPDQRGYKPAGRKLLWMDRDALYLDAFGRYLWKADRDPQSEQKHWEQYLARKFGSAKAGKALYQWYVLTGPISPGMQNLKNQQAWLVKFSSQSN